MSKNKLTLEEIIKIIKEINLNIEVLSRFEKETGKTKKRIRNFIKCRCLKCSHEWDFIVERLKYVNCEKCSHAPKRKKQL